MEKYDNMSLFYYNFYKEITYWEARQYEDVEIDRYDFTQQIEQGKYRYIFEQFGTVLEREVTVFDYHNLYDRILNYLYTEIIAIDLYRVIKGEKLYQKINGKNKLLTIQDIAKAYDKEYEKLKYVFTEFIAKLEKPDNKTVEEYHKELMEAIKEVDKKIDSSNKPAWKKHLIDNGFTDENMNTLQPLDLVIAEYVKITKNPVKSLFIKKYFFNDGNIYSDSSCDKARDYANINAKNKK